MVKESEMDYWKQLSIDFMTEESDFDEDTCTIIRHELTWRSNSMCAC